MRLILEGERRVRLQAGGEGLTVESSDTAVRLSPLHMLAGALATGTYAVLAGWARQAGVETFDLEIALSWDYLPAPYRVGAFEMAIRWPDLPPDRRAAAIRALEHSTVENTLRRSTPVTRRFED